MGVLVLGRVLHEGHLEAASMGLCDRKDHFLRRAFDGGTLGSVLWGVR